MIQLNIKYRNELGQLVTRGFTHVKQCTQFVRRKKIKKYHIFYGKTQLIMINQKFYTVDEILLRVQSLQKEKL